MNSRHEPLFLENKESREIIVFIHGFMGSPRQFDRLAELSHKNGYNALSVLLPGHGGTLREFSSSTYRMWGAHLNSEIERLSECFDKIWLVGHSMGGLLALTVAKRPSKKLRGIFLIASPLELTFLSKEDIKIRLAQVFRDDYVGESSVPRSTSLAFHALAPMVEVRKLISVSKSVLPKIQTPVGAVYSVSDELVSIKTLRILKAGLINSSLEYHVIVDSLHSYYTDEEKQIIDEAVLAFVKKTG